MLGSLLAKVRSHAFCPVSAPTLKPASPPVLCQLCWRHHPDSVHDEDSVLGVASETQVNQAQNSCMHNCAILAEGLVCYADQFHPQMLRLAATSAVPVELPLLGMVSNLT